MLLKRRRQKHYSLSLCPVKRVDLLTLLLPGFGSINISHLINICCGVVAFSRGRFGVEGMRILFMSRTGKNSVVYLGDQSLFTVRPPERSLGSHPWPFVLQDDRLFSRGTWRKEGVLALGAMSIVLYSQHEIP